MSESREALAELVKKCLPYVERDRSLLTAGGISQINLLPTTGCWFVKSYYMTPVGVDGYENWQYDGYGRLRLPANLQNRHQGFPNYAILAHRVTWLITGNTLQKGKVLNHMCGFRPCANPGHIVQVKPKENVDHGILMGYGSVLAEGDDIEADDRKALLKSAKSNRRREAIKEFWS